MATIIIVYFEDVIIFLVHLMFCDHHREMTFQKQALIGTQKIIYFENW